MCIISRLYCLPVCVLAQCLNSYTITKSSHSMGFWHDQETQIGPSEKGQMKQFINVKIILFEQQKIFMRHKFLSSSVERNIIWLLCISTLLLITNKRRSILSLNLLTAIDRSIDWIGNGILLMHKQNEIIIYFERRTKRSITYDKIFNTIAGELFHSIQTRAISLLLSHSQNWLRLILIDKKSHNHVTIDNIVYRRIYTLINWPNWGHKKI